MAKKSVLKKVANQLREGYKKQDQFLEKTVRSLETVIVSLNTRQLMQGVTSEGKSLGEYKNKWYAKFKRTLNPRGVVDLKLTGAFHESFFLEDSLPIKIYASDPKTKKLTQEFSEKLFGLTQESKRILVVGHLKDKIVDYQKSLVRL
jgi:hypothetical protein